MSAEDLKLSQFLRSFFYKMITGVFFPCLNSIKEKGLSVYTMRPAETMLDYIISLIMLLSDQVMLTRSSTVRDS